MKRAGLYPGTFDPITKGHYDVIKRAARLVDRLVIGVAANAGKGPLFSQDERVAMVRAEVDGLVSNGSRIEVKPFGNLLVHFASSIGASIIIRGLRAVSDFEYELMMVGMNSRLDPEVETVFLMASDNHSFIASRLVKEIAVLDGDISPFVSARVAKQVAKRVRDMRGRGGRD